MDDEITTANFTKLREEMKVAFAELHAEIAALRADMEAGFMGVYKSMGTLAGAIQTVVTRLERIEQRLESLERERS